MLVELTTFTFDLDDSLLYGILTSLAVLLNLLIVYVRYSIITKRRTMKSIGVITDIQKEITQVKADVYNINEKLDNNIYTTLFDVLSLVASNKLGFDTPEEQGLWKFFKMNIRDIKEAYYQLKRVGLELLKSEAFINNLLSSPVPELRSCYNEQIDGKMYSYPKEFVDFVVDVQFKMWVKFVSDVKIDVSTMKSDDIMWEIVKSNAKDAFKVMIIKIINKFYSTRHLIGGSSQSPILEDKQIIRVLIANDQIDSAIKAMENYYTGNRQVEDALTIIAGNRRRAVTAKLMNLEDSDLSANISKSLLDLLNTYK